MEVAFIGPIIEKTLGCLCSPMVGRQIGYVSHYTGNIRRLRDKIKDLEVVMECIQRETKEAENRGETVHSSASAWLKEGTDAKAGVEKFLEEKLKGDRRCLKGLCPNIYSRYLLGRELDKMTKVIVRLEERGSRFQTVSQLPSRPSFGSRFRPPDYEDFESRKSVFEEIMKALKDDSRRVIGIWGMGGVGKTTLVKKAGALAKKEHTFDEVVLAVVSQNPVVINIQGQLADQLGIKLEGYSDVGRADSLRTGLKKAKKILVILDDIWNQLDLEKIGIAFEDGMKGSKVLFTSRKQTVCHEMQDQNPISIQRLSDEEALNLFQKKVDSTKQFHGMPDMAQKVCRECGGLPVAVLAVAGALKSKDKSGWDNVLEQLRTSNLKGIERVNKEVCISLIVSYNQLEYEATKSCFLFCCLFPEDFDIPIELLMRLGRGMGFLGDMKKLEVARNTVKGLVNELKDVCLLLKGKDEDHVKMHDVVRDVAISIASEGQFLIETGQNLEEWPERETYNSYTAISLLFNSVGIHKLPDGLECPKLHTLMIQSRYGFNISDIFFNGMNKLKVLALKGMVISSLPSSIQNLNDLRVLCLEDCILSDISLVGKLKRLEMFILHGSNINMLPTEIGDLSRLRLLDMRNCSYLETISPNSISRLSRLEGLFMPMEFKMWGRGGSNNHENCADVAELMPLSRLESLEIYVPSFDMWPREPVFPSLANLTSFKISINSILLRDEECGAWKKILKLVDVPLRFGVHVLLKKAEALYIFELKDLHDCSMDYGDRESFSDLTYLHAFSCEGVQEFMVNVLERQFPFERFSKLSVLKIDNCNFKCLLSPSAAKVLVQLQELTIKNCENVEAIIGRYEVASTGGVQPEERVDKIIFSSLKHLMLEDLPKLESFCPKMKQPSSLEESIYFSVGSLFNEKVIFPKLEELVIANVGEFKEIGFHHPAQESFSKLRELRVGRMNCLSTIGSPTLILRLQSLQELELRQCGSLIAVFKAGRRQVSNEEEIVAVDHKKAVVIEGFELPALQKLEIDGCHLLEEFCSEKCAQSKEELQETARNFFNDKIGFPNLRELRLVEMDKVKEIWMHSFPPPPLSFCNLTSLDIRRCPKLEWVIPPAILPRLHQLEWLHVSECESIRELMEVGVGSEEEEKHGAAAASVLPTLNRITLYDLPSLENLPWETAAAGFVSSRRSCLAFQCLTVLWINKCGRLRNLFSSPSTALAFAPRNLRSLQIMDCEKMEEIVSCRASMEKEVQVAVPSSSSSSAAAAAASNHDTIIIFPHLKNPILYKLPNLNSLSCPSGYLPFQESSLIPKDISLCPTQFTWEQLLRCRYNFHC